MISLDIDLLRVFVAITETQSFTGAGQRLYRTQSTVSLQLQRLEKQLGCRLLRRAQGHVDSLTPAGTTLLPYAHEMIRANERATAALDAGYLEGKVRLGLADEAAHQNLSAALARFQARHPLVHLEVVCATSGELEEWIHTGRTQLALVNRCNSEPIQSISCRRLYQERITWIMIQGANWAEGEPVPLICFPQGCAYRTRAIEALESKALPWRSVYTSASRQGVWSAVSAGLGVAALPLDGLDWLHPGSRLSPATGLGELGDVDVTLLSAETEESVEPQRSLRLCIQEQFTGR